ncbi:MAG: hypothetical protein MHM6MM_002187 [Cercozoa sp. M6MM]
MGQKNSKTKRSAASLMSLQGQTVSDESGRTRCSVTDTIETFWWDFVEPQRQKVGEVIYLRFFVEHPEYRRVFNKLPLKRHAATLMHMLSSLIQGMSDLKTLDRKVRELGQRHISYNVPRGAFSHMTEAVVAGMQDVFGADFTHSVRYAFIEMLNMCTAIMIEEIGDQPERTNLTFYNPEKYPLLQPRKFTQFLADADCMSYLELHLAREGKRNFTLFLDQVTKWQKACSTMKKSDRQTLAGEVFNTFFADQAADRITVLEEPLLAALRVSVTLDEIADEVFDDVAHAVRMHVRDNLLEGFRQSRYCQALISTKFEQPSN